MPPARTSDRHFFTSFAAYYLLTLTIGFGHSTTEIVRRDGGLRTVAIVHAVFGTAWLLLFVTQTFLIGAHRRRLHMALGRAGLPIMIGVFLTGVLAVLRLHLPAGELPATLVASEIGLFSLGLGYAVLGIVYRRSAPSHKRYFLMSMIMLSPAGIGRLFSLIGYQPASVLGFLLILFVLPLLAILLYDLVAYRKVFPATLVGLSLYAANLVVGRYWGAFVLDVVRPLLT